ncbi:hypothetical protein Tco_0436337 [Tanacetum coccineum]
MLAPSGGGLILYQAYGNLYAMTGRKAHLLEDKQIPSVGVFDKVFNIWKNGIDYAAGGRLRKLRPDEAWAAIERLAQYENEGWNGAFIPDEHIPVNNQRNVSTPSEPSRQEEFEHIMMNFILDQEARFRQLEDYMRAIAEEFMEFSLEVARRLKERIKENENKPRKIEKNIKYPDIKVLENSVKRDLLENLKKKTFPTFTNLLCVRHV